MLGLDMGDHRDSDASENEENHLKLLNSISQLESSQRVKPASRKEINSQVSEYNLVQGTFGNNDVISVKELASILGAKSQHEHVRKKVKTVTSISETLPKPLEKVVEERFKRSLGYQKVKHQLRRWNSIVYKNAIKDQMKFPLTHTPIKMQGSTDFMNHFKSSTPLEVEIASVLNPDDNNELKEKSNSEFPLTLEEMLEKRREMAQLRAKLSYKEARARRQSKIKSKKYHRILKREKIRQQLKEFELLQKTDPEAALKKLSELDKNRAQERASLRHRNTGQWAKNLSVRAKYDIESRKVLAEQLKMSREITQKVKTVESSDEEEIDENNVPKINYHEPIDNENPWLVKVSEEMENFITGYKKYWKEKNEELLKNENQKEQNFENKKDHSKAVQDNNKKRKRDSISEAPVKKKTIFIPKVSELNADLSKTKTKISNKNKISVSILPSSGVWIVSPVDEEFEKKDFETTEGNKLEMLFDELNDRMLKEAQKKIDIVKSELKAKEKNEIKKRKNLKKNENFDLNLKARNEVERPHVDVELLEGEDNEQSSVETSTFPYIGNPFPEIDPKNFIQVKPKKLHTFLPDNVTNGDDELDDEEAQQLMVEEAFGDDDVGAQFNEMKKQEEESKVNINPSLPGWGDWGGRDIKPSMRKKPLVILNKQPRKDKKKSDTIINEKENPNLKIHLVKGIPRPFKSVEAFEANIRTPLGRDWMPETAHQKLIQKQVETQLGAIIEPMNEEEIVRRNSKTKSLYKGKVKKWKN